MARGNSTIYTGKVDINKLIFFHQKEAWLGSYTGNASRANFHNKAVKLLEKLKEVESNEHT